MMMLRIALAAAWFLAHLATLAQAQVVSGSVRTLWSAAEDGATVSPDGKLVAFIDWNSGDVAVRDVITGIATRLTDKGVFAESVGFPEPFLVFSPNGDRVAFTFGNTKGGEPFRYELRLVGIDVPVQEVLAVYPPEVELVAPLDWAAGLGILFTTVAADGSSDLLFLDPGTGEVRVVEERPVGSGIINRALFTPDHRSVIYLADGAIQQVSVQGGTARPLGMDAEALLGWSIDGQNLLFHGTRGGVVGNWAVVMRDDRLIGDPVLEQPTAAGVLAAGQSVDGVAYLEPAAVPGLLVVTLDVPSGQVVHGPETIEIPTASVPGNPSWSRDGTRLALTLRIPNRTTHRVMVLEGFGGPLREIARIDMRVWGLDWSTDGRFIVVGGRADTRPLSWVGRIDVSTGIVERLAQVPVNAVAAGAEEEVAYVRAAPAGERTVRVTLLSEPGAIPRVLTTYSAAELPRTMSVSPDGRWVALVKAVDEGRASVLQLLPVGGGPERTLLRLERPDALELNVGGLPWAAGGDRVVVAMRRQGQRQLGVVDVDSGEITMVLFSPERGGRWHPTLHPGGAALVYIDGGEVNDLKLMTATRNDGR
jgi:Tol biopolymer transport system component